VLDQATKLWEPAAAQNLIREAIGHEQLLLGLQATAAVDFARQTESIVLRAEENALLAHLTGSTAAAFEEIGATAKLNAGSIAIFAYTWLLRSRARAVFVEPTGSAERGVGDLGRALVFAPGDELSVKIDPAALGNYVHGPNGDLRTATLKNGLEVVLVRRPTTPTVTVTLGFRGGEASGEPLGASELAQMVARPTKVRNGPPVIFGARLWSWETRDTTFFQGSAASGNLENILAMLADGVDSMHVDASQLDPMGKDALLTYLRYGEARPSAASNRTFLAEIYPGSPYGRTPVTRDLEKLGGGDVQRWIDHTYRPRNAVMAVVGDIDLAVAEKQVRDWFDGWRGEVDSTAEASLRKLDDGGGGTRIVRFDRPGATQTELRMGCSLVFGSPTDRVALELLASRVQRGVHRLARATLGGSYGFSGGARMHRQAGELDIWGMVDDRSLTRVLALVRKDFEKLGEERLGDEELKFLKWRVGSDFNVRYSTNGDLARGLVTARLAGLPNDFLQKYPELLGGLTAEDVARVASACGKTAVLMLTGDPGVTAAALKSTTR